MPSDIRDETPHHVESNGEGIRVTDGSTRTQNSLEQADNSHPSVHHASTAGRRISISSPDEGSQPPSSPVVLPISDSRGYASSPRFEETGPRSSVWHAYLDESRNYDTNMVKEQRERANILLVFAGLFSAVVSAFIVQSSANLQPDYQQLSALLLFDQVNIQLALANGISADDIIISGTDPIAAFTPNLFDTIINGLFLSSLNLSMATAFLAVLQDQWYSHYLSPIAGDPQVRSRTRQFRYKALLDWHMNTLSDLLPLLLHLSIILFSSGLTLSLFTKQGAIGYVAACTSISVFFLYLVASIVPLFDPECPYKTLFTAGLYAIQNRITRRFTTVLNAVSPLAIQVGEIETLKDVEIYSAEGSRIKYEVEALHWLYVQSSNSDIHHLVIQHLAVLSLGYIVKAEKNFYPQWVDIRHEMDGMLMDCMEVARNGTTRWIPKDIPNIDRRIEPLLRLEILFPALRRKFPSRLFGEHNLDFSRKLSNMLSITLSCINDPHIQKPTDQNQVFMDALADNGVHHSLVWEKLLHCHVVQENLLHDAGDGFTIEMCLNLVTSIYLPEDSPPESYSCTLAYASVKYYRPEILKALLSFFSTSGSHNNPLVDPERRLSLAILRALAPDSASSTFDSDQHHSLHHGSTISKYRLLRAALHAINIDIHCHPIDLPSKCWRTDVFWAILSYMMSDLYTGRPLSNSEDSEFKDLFWTCRAHALVCMASLMHGGSKYSAVETNTEWATKPLFLNILRVIHEEPVWDVPLLPPVRVIPDPPQRDDSIIGVVGWLLGQAFKQGIPGAYEAFQEKGSLCCIAENNSLHRELIKGLGDYITGLSAAKAGAFPDIQSDDFPDRHIEDLHQATVIRCICASIALSGTQPRPILSSLVSIDPNHFEWDGILETLKSPTDENSIEKYIFGRETSPDDREPLKKNMKETAEILDECLEEARGRRNAINWLSTSFHPHRRSPETQDGHRWLNWIRKPRNGNTDIEAVALHRL